MVTPERRRVAWPLWLAVLVVLGATCDTGETDESTPTTARPLQVTFDEAGRPYDEHLPDGFELARERLVDLHLPSGRVAISSGEVIPWLVSDDPDARYLDLGEPGEHRVEVVWLLRTDDPESRSPAGLIIAATDAPVARWSAFEPAYGTDGGMGAISTPEYHRLNGERTWEERELGAANRLLDEWGPEEPLVIGDLDPIPGPDTIVFSNGFGDGGFPMARGFDGEGALAAVAIWHLVGPWRQAVPEGTPPADVTTREEQLIECLAGTRAITNNGWCVSD